MVTTTRHDQDYCLYSGDPRQAGDTAVSARLSGSRPCGLAGDVAVFFSGTLTNAGALARGAGIDGRVTPEALIAGLHAEHGAAVAGLLEGAYAVVIHGPDETLLFRDRGNLEDLYYQRPGPGQCVIATTIAALGQHVDLALNEEALPEFFVFSNLNSHQTFFRDVFSPRLDEYVRWDHERDEWTRHVHDSTAYTALEDERLGDEAIVDRIETSMRKSLADLVEEFPDATLVNTLSGGVDSSLLQVWMQELGFRESHCLNLDGHGHDAEYSNGVAEYLHADHHIFSFHLEDFASRLEIGIARTEKPLVFEGEAMFVDMYARIGERHGARPVVCLNGSGADAVFGHGKSLNVVNYLRRAPRLFRLLERPLSLVKPGHGDVLRKTLAAIREDIVTPEFLIAITRRDGVARIVGEALDRPAIDSARARCDDANRYPVRLLERLYRTHIFRSDCLRNDNCDYRSARAGGVLLTFPFLDRELVRFLLNVPLERKIRRAGKKYFAKRLLARHLPGTLIHRKKRPKCTPFVDMFRTDPGLVRLIGELREARYPYFEFDFDRIFSTPALQELALKLIDFHVWHRRFIG